MRDFAEQGYNVVTAKQGADVHVINTCTVTSRSDGKCRRTIQRILRNHPDATILVVGCLSQVNADLLTTWQGVDYILGSQEKHTIFQYFSEPGKQHQPQVVVQPFDPAVPAFGKQGAFEKQTRAFLKIQDGCDNRCAYCIVPFARGPSRSIPRQDLLESAKRLLSQGHKEIVLTGVHVGDYGKESGGVSQLSDLLEALLLVPDMKRIRLSSLNPDDITHKLLAIIQNDSRVCRHFHIPVQSGSHTILRAMNRSYSPQFVKERIQLIQKTLGPVGLGSDVIVAFPGETDALFQETVQLIESLPFTYLHVFPYSRRPGTKAFDMPNQVPSQVKKERAQILRELGEEKKRAFLQFWVGKSIDVLFESKKMKGLMGGFSSEYVRVEVPFDPSWVNQVVSVKINEVHQGVLRGSAIL